MNKDSLLARTIRAVVFLVAVIFFFIVLASLTSCSGSSFSGSKIKTASKAVLNPVRKFRVIKDTCIYQQRKIRKLFAAWQKKEVKAHQFLDSCNWDWSADHKNSNIDWGFPDSTRITFSFADLNNDEKLDGMATFTPDQCDGGNASMWTQIQVFFISGRIKYLVTDEVDVSKFSGTGFDGKGFYWLDSISKNKINGTYYEFKDYDGHCCPSIKWPVTFDFKTKKLISVFKNES